MLFAGSSAGPRMLRASPNIWHLVYMSKFHEIYSKFLFTPEVSEKDVSLLETPPDKLEKICFPNQFFFRWNGSWLLLPAAQILNEQYIHCGSTCFLLGQLILFCLAAICWSIICILEIHLRQQPEGASTLVVVALAEPLLQRKQLCWILCHLLTQSHQSKF